MQTFLPYPTFTRSARCLDRARLGKQRIEAKMIYRALMPSPFAYGWRHHPAVKMWQGCECSLLCYGIAICTEWRARGYRDSQLDWFQEAYDRCTAPPILPSWIGNRRFHRSHQSNLVRKLPSHYRKFFPNVPADLPYVWPSVRSQSCS